MFPNYRLYVFNLRLSPGFVCPSFASQEPKQLRVVREKKNSAQTIMINAFKVDFFWGAPTLYKSETSWRNSKLQATARKENCINIKFSLNTKGNDFDLTLFSMGSFMNFKAPFSIYERKANIGNFLFSRVELIFTSAQKN